MSGRQLRPWLAAWLFIGAALGLGACATAPSVQSTATQGQASQEATLASPPRANAGNAPVTQEPPVADPRAPEVADAKTRNASNADSEVAAANAHAGHAHHTPDVPVAPPAAAPPAPADAATVVAAKIPERAPATVETRPVQAPPKPAARAPTAPALTLAGRLRLEPGRRQQVDAVDYAEAVVWFIPEGSHVVNPGTFTMHTRQKGFEPAVLAIPVGSRVSFPNGDPVLHNVYSDTSGQSFDLGLYGAGQSPVHQFKQPGVVHVHCNVHRRMQAKIVVVESHLIARIAADGGFEITGVPAGAGKLVAWHPRGDRIERRIVEVGSSPIDVELPLVRPRAAAFAEGARQ